jgi:hypothetical protein
MASLMKHGARVEKIMQKGNLNEGQVNLLNSAYGAHQKFQKQTSIFIWSIIGISLVVISFFTVQMLRYKARRASRCFPRW